MGYFTAGVMILLGIVLIVKFGREMKICYPAGGVFVLLGAWWALSTMYPENPVINGWVNWVVKGVAAAMLIVMGIVFFVGRKKEVDKFKASKEEAKEKRTTMYENYDDFQYEDDKGKADDNDKSSD